MNYFKKRSYTTYPTPIVVLGAIFTLLAGICFALGWILDVAFLKHIIPESPSIKFNTALCLILLASSQLLSIRNSSFQRLIQLISGFVFLIAMLVLLQYILGISIGVDEFFYKDIEAGELNNSFPGRMSPISAVSFLLISSAFFLQTRLGKKTAIFAQGFLHLSSLLAFIAILGYFTGIDKLYKIADFTVIAIHTAVCLLVLSVTAAFRNPSLGLIGLFSGDQVGNLMARKLISRVSITIVLLTTIRLVAHEYAFVDVDFGIVLFALSFFLTILYFTGSVAGQLNKAVLDKENAETMLSKVSQFLDATPDPLVIVNTTGVIIFASKKTELVFGYSNEELLGQKIDLLIPDRYQKNHTNFIHHFFKTPVSRAMGAGVDLYAITKHQREIPVEISLNPIATASGMLVAASIRNVSQRKEIALQLKKANEQYAIFVKEAPSAIAMFDNEMNYISASNKWITDYHLENQPIIGRSHYEIFPEIGQEWKQIHQDCLQGAVNKCEEAFFTRSDGTLQWLSWDVRPWYKPDQSIGGLIMLTADLTATKQKEIDKLRFENILEKTSSISQIGAWEVSLRTGEVHWSAVLKEILEANDDHAPNLQAAIDMYAEGENRHLITQAFARASENGEPFDLEIELLSLKGKAIPARIIGQAENINGHAVRLFGVLQNLEKVKETELELKQLLDLSDDQNKRLKNFAQIVSHNLRSHSGNIHMLLQSLVKKEPALKDKEVVQHILAGSQSLQETIRNLSDIVVINTNTGENMIPVLLKDIIDQSIASVSQMAKEASVAIINQVPSDYKIVAVKAYTESILLNFLTNGIKYKSPHRDSYVKFSAILSEKFLILSIEDNGLGIDLVKNRDKLFGMYKTFHRNPDARGLGLFMSKNQMEAMGGRIEVESTPDEGTHFKLFFQL